MKVHEISRTALDELLESRRLKDCKIGKGEYMTVGGTAWFGEIDNCFWIECRHKTADAARIYVGVLDECNVIEDELDKVVAFEREVWHVMGEGDFAWR